MMPQYPNQIITRPFANNGETRRIPDTTSTQGQASYAQGFPVETQLPLANGGIAPSRLDFNGILNVLSAMGFWQQSGGQMLYQAALSYTRPSIVHHNGRLWWCVADNGPDALTGVVEPGSNPNIWMDLMDFLTSGDGSPGSGRPGTGGAAIRPVGEIIQFYGGTPMGQLGIAPDGFLVCDGGSFPAGKYPQLEALLGGTNTPDLRGVVLRGYDPGHVRDPQGGSRYAGHIQGDAMRNLTGTIAAPMPESTGTGVFSASPGQNSHGSAFIFYDSATFSFDASRQVPIASEFRMVNACILFCIKHD